MALVAAVVLAVAIAADNPTVSSQTENRCQDTSGASFTSGSALIFGSGLDFVPGRSFRFLVAVPGFRELSEGRFVPHSKGPDPKPLNPKPLNPKTLSPKPKPLNPKPLNTKTL